MPKFVRCVGSRARWERSDEFEDAREFSSDAFVDVKTSGRRLSIYQAQDESELNLVAYSLASGRGNLDLIDFVWFDEDVFDGLEVEIVRTDGNTACPAANALHYDIVGLTGRALSELVSRIVWNGGEAVRVKKKAVREGVGKLLADGGITLTDQSPVWLRDLRMEV